MAGCGTLGSWTVTLLATLIAAVGGSVAAYGGPLNDHAHETPRMAVESCVEGTVVILIGIDATGSVSASKVVESHSPCKGKTRAPLQ